MNLKEKSQPKFDPEQRMLAMFRLYATRSQQPEPDETGAYFIGDVGDAPEKTWARPIGPYSVAERRE